MQKKKARLNALATHQPQAQLRPRVFQGCTVLRHQLGQVRVWFCTSEPMFARLLLPESRHCRAIPAVRFKQDWTGCETSLKFGLNFCTLLLAAATQPSPKFTNQRSLSQVYLAARLHPTIPALCCAACFLQARSFEQFVKKEKQNMARCMCPAQCL